MEFTPTHFTSGANDAMQKYMLLSSQQEVVRRRLSLDVPSPMPMNVESPEMRSLSSSPTSTRPSSDASWSSEAYHSNDHPLSAYPIPMHPGPAHRHSIQVDDSHRLSEINHQIKATLTELLNTESVRSDEKYRAWIQTRLMDAEHQMRKQRRRTSGADRDIAQAIALSFSP